MDLLEYIAEAGCLIFLGVASWAGIFLIVAFGSQKAKDYIVERKRVTGAAKQDAWKVD